MPRTPRPGLRWVSIEIDDDSYQILKEAARRDKRSLTMFLRIELGELASEIVFKNLKEGKSAYPAPQQPLELEPKSSEPENQ